MYTNLKELLIKYERLGLFADEYFANEVIETICNEMDINDAVTEVKFELPQNALYGTIANYLPEEKAIALKLEYRKDIDKYFNLLYKNEFEDKSKVFAQNLFLVHVLFHELDHARFFKELAGGENDIIHKLWNVVDPTSLEEKFKSDKNILKATGQLFKLLLTYSKYHDYAPYETRAIISSAISLSNLTNKLYDSDINENDIKFYDKAINIMYDYELIRRYKKKEKNIYNSPSYDFCNKLSYNKELFPEELNLYNKNRTESFREDSSKYSLAERLLQGLQISEEEYNNILNGSSLLENKKQFKTLKRIVK